MPIVEQLKKACQNKHNWILVVIVLIGIALIAWPTGKKAETKKQPAPEEEASMEARLSSSLSQIEGAGSVSVMITYDSGAEKSIAYDTTEEDGTGSGRRSQKQAVVTNGDAVVLKENTPAIRGVLVVAAGANNPSVQLQLSQAVQTVLGVESYQVTVVKKGA